MIHCGCWVRTMSRTKETKPPHLGCLGKCPEQMLAERRVRDAGISINILRWKWYLFYYFFPIIITWHVFVGHLNKMLACENAYVMRKLEITLLFWGPQLSILQQIIRCGCKVRTMTRTKETKPPYLGYLGKSQRVIRPINQTISYGSCLIVINYDSNNHPTWKHVYKIILMVIFFFLNKG